MIIEEKVMEEFLNGVKHGFLACFDQAKLIARGLEYKRQIPKSFWKSAEDTGIFDRCYIPKKELCEMREETINAVVSIISAEASRPKFKADHFTRYFHILTILGVPKNSNFIPKINGINYQYGISRELWDWDDGNEEKFEKIMHIAWMASEL